MQDTTPFTREELDLEKKIAERLNEGRLDILVMPQVILQVLKLLDSDKATISEIAKEVSRDPGVATHVLALANSAFYRGAVSVTSIEQAVVRLGFRELKGAVLMISLRNFFRNEAYPELASSLWQHSLATAIVSKYVARLADTDADAVFMGGLVHDIGKIAVLALYERLIAGHEAPKVGEEPLGLILQEHHVEAGRLLARDWDLPAAAAEAIITHHADIRRGIHSKEGRVVALANKLTHLMGLSSSGTSIVEDDMDAACRELGIDSDMQVKLIEETPTLVAELERITA